MSETAKSYETRRTMEGFANMREEIKRIRSINADLLAALQEALITLSHLAPQHEAAEVERIRTNGMIRAAIFKATQP